jgi:hypothetical protein
VAGTAGTAETASAASANDGALKSSNMKSNLCFMKYPVEKSKY